MMPPKDIVKALKDHPNGLVAVVAFFVAGTLLLKGIDPWAVLGLLLICLGTFHIRSLASERHGIRMRELELERTALKIEETKARYRALLDVGQPSLPLSERSRRLTGGADDEGRS